MTAKTVGEKLYRAHCIVAQVAKTMLENNQDLTGETLKAAEDLITAAMVQLGEVDE